MRRFILLASFALLLFPALTPVPAHASSPVTQFAVCGKGLNDIFGIQPWFACLPHDKNGNPIIQSLTDVFLILFPLVESLVKIGAYVAAGFIFYMLFKMMYARGDPSKIATAAQGIRDAVVGFIFCLISVAIVNFIAGSL